MKKSDLNEAFKSLKKTVIECGAEITYPNSIKGGNCPQLQSCGTYNPSCKKVGNTTTTTISPTTTVGKAF